MAEIINSTYSSQDTEKKWYQHWLDKGYFRSVPDEREPFTIVIPPPNVTGVLHMGHLLNNTIQDILIRKARMEGKNACWVPGTDHASIATEAKVVRLLREKGIKKGDISREEFLKHAFEWKDKYGGIILDQLKMLGASCDWDRTRFTMEEKLSKAVLKSFVDLYKKGQLYRAKRMVNWDPEAQTVLSNEEVIYTEEHGKLYFVRYRIEGTEEYLTIATTRPETIMGDTAIAVHPDDERYKHLHGKFAIVPIVNRRVPVIADDYIDPEFGTGALKVTPAHDQADYELGQKHKLEVVDTLNDDGTLSEEATIFVGEDRFAVRKKMKEVLEKEGALVEVKDYQNKVGRSERTNAVVEPRLKLQWFLNMESLANMALDAVEDGEVKFYPDTFRNMYRVWLSNIKDWCISRQLWWGQRIPAYYYRDAEGKEHIFVAETDAEALAQAQAQFPHISAADLLQDEDVVDTWFSSWLWPISVFDGFEEGSKDFAYYYPTNVLVTGWDIIFFWVARMIMAGYEWQGKHPFRDVYFTGMVRDQYRRKMSKSLGNSPDAIELLRKYGADGVRFGLLSSSPAGGDLVFDAPFDKESKEILNESALCEQGRNFCNKLWNALRLIKGWEIAEDLPVPASSALAVRWFEQKYNQVLAEVEESMSSYRLSEALKTIYSFIWDDFCSWYLEMIKPAYQQPIDRQSYDTAIVFFEKLMKLLHPFMPFITEEIWNTLRTRAEGQDVCVAQWEKSGNFDKDFLYKIELMKDLIAKVRDTRNSNQLKPKDPLPLMVRASESATAFLSESGIKETIIKLAFLSDFNATEQEPEGASFISGTEQYYLVFSKEVNVEEERAKLQKELEHVRNFINGINKKLENEKFVASAPAQVVENERKKLADGLAREQLLEQALTKLS